LAHVAVSQSVRLTGEFVRTNQGTGARSPRSRSSSGAAHRSHAVFRHQAELEAPALRALKLEPNGS
jgi:hypothetical protein